MPPHCESLDGPVVQAAVSVHRSGEGETFTGLKLSGLDVGAVIPTAEHTVAAGDPSPLTDLLVEELRGQIPERFESIREARVAADPDGSVTAERAYVDAVLGLEVWAHHLHQRIVGPPHAAN